ncbi:hypothetical protein VTO42DRAFT_5172 [Malbranchea cinnamomea]
MMFFLFGCVLQRHPVTSYWGAKIGWPENRTKAHRHGRADNDDPEKVGDRVIQVSRGKALLSPDHFIESKWTLCRVQKKKRR